MRKTQWWHKYVFLVGIFAFVTLMGYLVLNTFIWKDFSDRITTAENQKVGLQEKLEDAKRADELIEQLTAQINLLIGGNETEMGKLEKAIDVPDLLREMEKASSISGLEVSSILLDGTGNYVRRPTVALTTADGTVNIYNIGITMDAKGSYEALKSFVKSFEDSGYYVTVQNIEMARKDTLIFEDIDGEIRLVIYSTSSGGASADNVVNAGDAVLEDTDKVTDDKVEDTSTPSEKPEDTNTTDEENIKDTNTETSVSDSNIEENEGSETESNTTPVEEQNSETTSGTENRVTEDIMRN